jgi:hypothetical protein
MRRRCVKSTTEAVMPHARSLAPLVKARGFGMTLCLWRSTECAFCFF